MSDSKPDPGIFIVKGDIVSVQPFSISINDKGEIEGEPVVLHTGIDMTGYWLEIAYKHLLSTQAAHKKLMLAKESKDDEKISYYLKKESTSGMQTVMSAGIALDAYYASVKEHVNVSKPTLDAWREKGTARYKQISEVLRIGFCLKNEGSKNLQGILKQNFKFRDKAVHPRPGTSAPALHVELNKVTDWRYVSFRFYNAKAIFGLSLSVVFKTASEPNKNIDDGLKIFCESLTPRINPIVKKWRKRFGELL